MEISTTRGIAQGLSSKFRLPNLVDRFMVPTKVTLLEKDDNGEFVAAKNADITVLCNNTAIFNAQQAYLTITNEFSLLDRQHELMDNSQVQIYIKNTDRMDHHEYLIKTTYEKSFGKVIFQNSYDVFDNVTSEIRNAGIPSRIVLNFNKPTPKIDLISLFDQDSVNEDVDSSWFESLELESKSNSFVLDLTDNDLKLYSQYLNFMKLKVPSVDSDTDPDTKLMLHVVAYGFK